MLLVTPAELRFLPQRLCPWRDREGALRADLGVASCSEQVNRKSKNSDDQLWLQISSLFAQRCSGSYGPWQRKGGWVTMGGTEDRLRGEGAVLGVREAAQAGARGGREAS